MASRTVVLPFVFVPKPWDEKVEAICQSWVGTPYKLNACKKKVGVDCIHFGAGFLDEMYGTKHSKKLASLPADACVHNRAGVEKAARTLLTTYPSHERVLNNSLESGDLVILGPESTKTASHLLVAGTHGKLWQATAMGILVSGYGLNDGQALVAVYRANDKDKWLDAGLR